MRAVAMWLLTAACVSPSMRLPPGDPARPDGASAEPAEPALILTSTVAAAPGAGEALPAHPHHDHGGEE